MKLTLKVSFTLTISKFTFTIAAVPSAQLRLKLTVHLKWEKQGFEALFVCHICTAAAEKNQE